MVALVNAIRWAKVGGDILRRAVGPIVRFRAAVFSAYNNGSTTVIFTSSGVVQAGNLILVTFYLGSSTTITPPTGFTQLLSPTPFTDAAAAYTSYIYYKIADGSENATLTFTLGKSTDHTGLLAVYSGTDTTTPFDVTPVVAAASGTTLTAPTLTTVTGQTKNIVLGYDWNGFAGTEVATPGYAIRFLNGTNDLVLEDSDQVPIGAAGSKSMTIATGPWLAYQIALRHQ